MRAIAIVIVLLLSTSAALPLPPPGADPTSPIGQWFESLKAPNGASCCSQADCRVAQYRIVVDHYEVLVGAQFKMDPPRWLPVAPDRVLKRENPLDLAVACFIPSFGILCFVPPDQA